MRRLLILFLLCFVCTDLYAQTARQRREIEEIRNRYGAPPGLEGSLAVENAILRRDDITRLRDWAHVEEFRKLGLLVYLERSGTGYWFNYSISRQRSRLMRPAARFFIKDLGESHHETCRRNFKVSSGLRPISRQIADGLDCVIRITRRNGKVVYIKRRDCKGRSDESSRDYKSTHPAGTTFDISKRGLNRCSLGFLENRLLEIERAGVIDVIGEKNAFHVMVFPQEYMTRSGRTNQRK